MLSVSFLAVVDWFWRLNESFGTPVFLFDVLIVSFRRVIDSDWTLNQWLGMIVDRIDAASLSFPGEGGEPGGVSPRTLAIAVQSPGADAARLT